MSHNDTTFRAYSTTQAEEYARRRGGYPPKLIEEIITLHSQTNGGFSTLLDLGCGPGSATRPLAAHFDHAFGIDPSAEMINTARTVGGNAKLGSIQFLQDEAELCESIPDHSVDLITAATAAHWFDMERFWPTAMRVLKPHGTVAFFTIWRTYCDPAVTPYAREIHSIILELEQNSDALGAYQKPGNWLQMGLYQDLHMPWSISTLSPGFVESSYRRQVWNEDGVASDDGSYVSGGKVRSLDEAEKGISTISAVTRWREAHPKLANTKYDCVAAAFSKIGELLGPGQNVTMVGPTVLLTVKKS